MYKFNKLKNNYVIWRHGESEANEQQIIASKLESGIYNYGLTQFGKKQVLLNTQKINLDISSVVIYSSPFKRCRETSAIIASAYKVSYSIQVDYALRERHFGNLDGLHKSYYKLIYESDLLNDLENSFGAESVWSVQYRLIFFINKIEQIHSSRTIILVTHADVGEILQATFQRHPPYLHRQLPKLHNAEARILKLRH